MKRFLGCLPLFVCSLTLAQSAPEELRLRNGNVLKGQFVEGDKQTIIFRSEGGLQTYPKRDVRAVVFDTGEAVASDSEFPPGFSAKPPLKIKRVISYRRITRNRGTEEGQFEPEVMTLSGDGTTIVFWTRKGGFFAINADGSNRRQILARKDNAEHFNAEWGGRLALSHDGKVMYWQGGQSAPIRRINTDGTDERLLVRAGAEYHAFQLREDCGRIFFSSRGGIFSIDTEGKGDYKEIVTHVQLGKLWEVSSDWTMLGDFDVSADGSKIAFAVGGYPKAKARQLMAINADGSGMRRIVETDFEPSHLRMSADGKQILFWKYGQKGFIVNWDGSGLRELAWPAWDGNHGGFQHLSRFSPDGARFVYNCGYAGGMQEYRLDDSDRFEPLASGRWDGYPDPVFWGYYTPTFSRDLKRFATMTQYWQQSKPRQVLVGDVNPRTAPGLPVVSDVEFPALLSVNPQVPQHTGTIKCKVAKGDSDVERVQFILLSSADYARNKRWQPDLGWWGLEGDHQMRDDGKNGDEKAGDGIYTSNNLTPHTTDYQPTEGRHVLRIIVHDDQNAVAVDVDGVEIK